ncbi:DMT family transporter [Micromonospora siamensis]|uniref:Permease of the drug/metabolite transporter (DMT) superfamily n=1 Tax=Micromonospora siamensis TaxID=299152 RepID=A0A1C5IM30_9ACTN|nr:DMT family transporter [Micromonospora siamensis]SCG59362.1 Permease of the drug/metabolite transporter (DMT) superfamily [Micromonospora siamensis]
MRDKSSVTVGGSVTAGRAAGLALGALGVLGFSLSLPATRVAVQQLDPWFVAFGRAVGAALLAGAYLHGVGATRPTRDQWRRLSIVALGVVVGFPLFTSLALLSQTSAHGAVVVTVLPAMTAVFAVLRAGERPSPLFWAASAGGMLAVLTFLGASGAVHGSLSLADLSLLAAVVLCGLGYAEGGALARQLGGARTICWALLLALPVTVPVTVLAGVIHPPRADATTWSAFGYLTVVSMFLGFFAWYAGLARGGIAHVGQVQLAQPVLTLVWSALLLGERVTAASVAAAVAVLACVVVTQRSRLAGRPAGVGLFAALAPDEKEAYRPAPAERIVQPGAPGQ